MRRVTSIDEAIVFLGVSTLRHLSLTLEVFTTFGGAKCPGVSFEALEQHALLTAKIARKLMSDPGRTEAAFAAGLLHDCGQLVLANRLPAQFSEAVARSRSEGRVLYQVERELLGADHAEVGAYLLGLWGLPHAIVEAVAFHHAEERMTPGNLDVVMAVEVANLLAHTVTGTPGELEKAGGAALLGRLAGDRRQAWLRLATAEATGMPGPQQEERS
jgi:HD-like signal output (HDOD) protein